VKLDLKRSYFKNIEFSGLDSIAEDFGGIGFVLSGNFYYIFVIARMFAETLSVIDFKIFNK
jgi:hypothetical protein